MTGPFGSTSGLARACLPRGAGAGFLEAIGYLRVGGDRHDDAEQGGVEFLFRRRDGRVGDSSACPRRSGSVQRGRSAGSAKRT